MPKDPLPASAQLEAERARVIQALSDHFAYDHITLQELERRLERAYAVDTSHELSELVSGLPALEHESPVAVAAPRSAGVAHVPERRFLLAFMSGVVRKGVWTAAREISAVAFMGGVDLDFREAIISPGVTHIRAFAFMGGVTVKVPPNVRLESDGFAIMGGFEDKQLESAPYDPDAPVIRVTGFAFMGGVDARVAKQRRSE